MRKVIAGFYLLSLFAVHGWAQQYYDLGGPCRDEGLTKGREIAAAEKSGAWDQLVELQRDSVRRGCRIEYRWQELVSALVRAGRYVETERLLQEMDARGFDLSPRALGERRPEVQTFMRSAGFKATPIGMKLEQLRTIADERRARYAAELKKLSRDQKPPEHYIAKDACPFEGCRYGDWSVLEDTELVAEPGSKRVVGKISKGSRAMALTGEVHLKPEPVVVLLGEGLPKDSIAFILDYQGEGFGHVYTGGNIVSVFLGYADYCFRLSDTCWGETILPTQEPAKRVWWIKVQLANGVIGWTDKADHFGDNDKLG